jgi:hypothetical protein
MDPIEIGCNCMDWYHLAWNKIKWWAVVKTILNIAGSIEYTEFLDQLRKKDYPHVVSQSVTELVTSSHLYDVLFDVRSEVLTHTDIK